MKEYPYWPETVPASEVAPGRPSGWSLEVRNREWDVVIVGAGYTGLAAARALAAAGAAVLVLDREGIGWGASSRNGGQVLTGLRVDAGTLVSRYGERRARELFAVSSEAIGRLEAIIERESIACDYQRTGHIQAAAKPAHFAGFRDEQALLARVFAHHVHIVSRADQRQELGSDRYHGLLIDEKSSGLNPAQYVDGLAAAARRAGAVLVSPLGVEHVRRRGTGWNVNVSAADGQAFEVSASDVLMATNGYTDNAAPALRRRFVPVGSYIIVTEPLDESVATALLPRRRMAFDSNHFLHYFRVTSDRRLLFGGRAEFSVPSAEATRHAASVLKNDMVALFPQLADARVAFAWSGNVAFTRDEMPHAGRLDDGVYYAGGYCGHGIAMATYLGELVGRRMAGEPIEHPLMDDHFPAIPLYSGKPWFLPLVGAYYRVLDRLY